MEELNRIRKASLWIFIFQVVAIHSCLIISVNYHLFENTIFIVDQIGRSGFTIPYIDGSLSISRASRTYPAYLLFKPGMIITAIILIQYWILNNNLFKKIDDFSKKNRSFLFFGIGSAVFLILHSILLGINFETDLYKFLRRFVLLGFVIFELIAQTILVLNIIKIKSKILEFINVKILTLKIILVSVLVITAILSAPILNSYEHTHFKHALEWNYFLGIVTFYLLTFLFWKKN